MKRVIRWFLRQRLKPRQTLQEKAIQTRTQTCRIRKLRPSNSASYLHFRFHFLSSFPGEQQKENIMITIHKLPAEAERFQTYLPGLADPLPPATIALEARVDGLFAGTALILAHPRSASGSIRVLYTPELFRNLGVGSRLLEESEQYLRSIGCHTARITLTLRQGKSPAELDFFHKRGYGSDQVLYRTYTMRSSSILGSRYMELHLPEGFELKPLLSAGTDERAELEQLAAELPADVAPFQEERVLHPELSTLMKIDGRVAGWMGIQQMASNLLLLRSLYIRPEYRLRASVAALFVEMHRKYGMLDRFAYQMLNVSGENEAMLRLADRKFAPHASSIKSMVRLEKRL
ncbi:hypothetical protein B9G55_02380 [Saccharibacillus sp. O16]|nr:hypothetical protein B9G55_02380 [Saccharibacillus sp. O16]